MKTIKINQAIIEQACRANLHPSPTSDLSSKKKPTERFREICREIVPNWQDREDHRDVLNDIYRWCIKVKGNLDPNKGLWLFGNIGTGKSTLLAIIKEFCKEYRGQYYSLEYKSYKPYTYRITNVIDVCGAYQRDGYNGIDTYVNGQCQAFDEIGSESIPTGHFGTAENVMQYILQRRYDHYKSADTYITHATSNLSPEQIIERYGERIYDRCREMFNFVPMLGASFRG